MKKIFLIGFLLAVGNSGFSQLTYGVKAGAQLTKEDFSNHEFTSSFKPSFYAGFVGRYDLSDRVALYTELLFSREGSNQHGPMFTGSITRDYLNVPLLGNFQLLKNWRVNTGPGIQFTLNASEEINSQTSSVKTFTKPVILDWIAGSSYEWNQWGAEIRYQRSISAINKGTVAGGTIKGQLWSAGLFFRFL